MERLNIFSYLQYFSATLSLVFAASITFPMQAQGQGGGKGNNSGPGNVIAWYDEALNTLFVNGNDSYKHILIEIRDTNASVVALANATINGSSSFRPPITGQNPKLAVSAGGLIQINVATDEQVYDVQIDLGAGDDTLWIGLNIPAAQPMPYHRNGEAFQQAANQEPVFSIELDYLLPDKWLERTPRTAGRSITSDVRNPHQNPAGQSCVRENAQALPGNRIECRIECRK